MKSNKTKLLIAVLAASTLGMVGCQKKKQSKNTFGIFSHNGVFLEQYAVNEISVEEAKKLVHIGNTNTNRNIPLTEKDQLTIQAILKEYASVLATVKYYVEDDEKQQVREDLYQGTDFLDILQHNRYTPFGQMSVDYIFVNDGLLDYMEEINTEFHNDTRNLICPFTSPYTYHQDDRGELVIQTHNFAELPSSVNGGIGSAFRQDCEIKFDTEGKICNWQSSLGLYTSTPTGTVKEGYIFEAAFNWNAK